MPTLIIPLTQGKFALIDAEDYPIIAGGSWQARQSGDGWYAQRITVDDCGKRTTISMHRLIAHAKKSEKVDHRNHDGLDNRKSNLRCCSHAQNMMNRRSATSQNISGYLGVQISKRLKDGTIRYCARVRRNGKDYSAGLFSDPVEAARARDRLAKKIHGQYASFNFPDEVSS